MTKEELKELRVRLYKVSPNKLELVDKLINLIKHCFNGVETNGIRFDSTFKLGKLSVKIIEIDPQEIGGVLIHWYPIKSVSLRNDPFCSAYILTEKEIKKIIDKIQSVKDFYDLHTKV